MNVSSHFFPFFSTFCNGLIIPIIGIVFMKYEWILNVSSKWCVDRMIRALKACRLSFFWEDCDKPSSSWKPKENDVVYPSLLSTEAIERLYVPLFRLHFGSSYLLSPLFQSAKILKIEPLFFPSFSDETTLFPIFFPPKKKKKSFDISSIGHWCNPLLRLEAVLDLSPFLFYFFTGPFEDPQISKEKGTAKPLP